MATRFTSDFSKPSKPLPHFWEYCVGSGRAALALRADWQGQLRRCRRELGFEHVRFHGVLNDDMGTLVKEEDNLLYSFQNADRILDFLRSIEMRPIVELSFMPRALASGDKTVFHYKANVTPPDDYNQWATLVSKLVAHWVDRYGSEEVATWPMEVWNEPNMEGFWTGSQQDYFRLFETTWKAIKHVNQSLRVGGPVTAKNAWIEEFIDYCTKADVPPDFISTHIYPTDAIGNPGDDTKKDLSQGHLGILREYAEKAREQAGKRALYYTEWSTSSNPRDELHDEPYAAAYIVHSMLSMERLVDAYSYWTFSDIFEENFFPARPFQGGFGLLTILGVPKPAYRAYEILHGLGHERLEVEGKHGTVHVWIVRGDDAVSVVIVNLALPLHDVETESVNVELFHVPAITSAQVRRIDASHANAKAKWKMQGEPDYPSPAEVAAMEDASRMRPEDVQIDWKDGTATFEISVQPQSVNVVELRLAAQADTASKAAGEKTVSRHEFTREDESLLEELQASAFRYFMENSSREKGIVADNTKAGADASIAATGFALSCYPIAAERGWITRKDAALLTRKTLAFFAESAQGPGAHVTGHKGFYYHFLDMDSGLRAQQCELSTLDTGLLLAGMMVGARYFDHHDTVESQIRELAEQLFARVDWRWALDTNGEINQAWKPSEGFGQPDWQGYSEALTMYVMGAASPTSPLSRPSYEAYAARYQWCRNAGMEWIHAAPLFIHLMPQAWIDLRGLEDRYVGKRGRLDYFENSRRAIAVQRSYAYLNPHSFDGYGRDIWGLSACEGPDGERELRDGRKNRFLGYAARGVPRGPDDGTLVPWGVAACVAHAPAEALSGLHAMLDAHPHALRHGQFVGAINPSLPGESSDGWVAPASFGIDQGLVTMMIENARSGLIWGLTRTAPVFTEGLRRLGFNGGWLDRVAA